MGRAQRKLLAEHRLMFHICCFRRRFLHVGVSSQWRELAAVLPDRGGCPQILGKPQRCGSWYLMVNPWDIGYKCGNVPAVRTVSPCALSHCSRPRGGHFRFPVQVFFSRKSTSFDENLTKTLKGLCNFGCISHIAQREHHQNRIRDDRQLADRSLSIQLRE